MASKLTADNLFASQPVSAHVVAAVKVLCDHSQYVVTETNRTAELYRFWSDYPVDETTSVTRKDTSEEAPPLRQTTEYIKSSTALSQVSESTKESLLTSCTSTGLSAQLDNTLFTATKMKAHLSDPSARAQTGALLEGLQQSLDVLQARAGAALDLVTEKKKLRDSGFEGRLEAVRAGKADTERRYNEAVEKLNKYHSGNMAKLEEQLRAPVEIPQINVNLTSPSRPPISQGSSDTSASSRE